VPRWPCCFVNGNLFTGPHNQSIVLRLSDEDQAALLKLKWGGGIRANAKRKMKGYVILGDPLKRDRQEPAQWINHSLHFARLTREKKKPSGRRRNVGARRKSDLRGRVVGPCYGRHRFAFSVRA
jgi:hypothetical protein